MISFRSTPLFNLIAQGRISAETGARWFAAHDAPDQNSILRALILVVTQSHPIEAEAAQAVALTGLRPTLPQCRDLLRADRSWGDRYHALLRSPPNEYPRAFALLLTLFTLADTRRRQTDCAGGCTHDWHHIAAGVEDEVMREMAAVAQAAGK